MERSQKSEERELAPTAMPRPKDKTTRIRFSIEELETRLAPQSTEGILD